MVVRGSVVRKHDEVYFVLQKNEGKLQCMRCKPNIVTYPIIVFERPDGSLNKIGVCTSEIHTLSATESFEDLGYIVTNSVSVDQIINNLVSLYMTKVIATYTEEPVTSFYKEAIHVAEYKVPVAKTMSEFFTPNLQSSLRVKEIDQKIAKTVNNSVEDPHNSTEKSFPLKKAPDHKRDELIGVSNGYSWYINEWGVCYPVDGSGTRMYIKPANYPEFVKIEMKKHQTEYFKDIYSDRKQRLYKYTVKIDNEQSKKMKNWDNDSLYYFTILFDQYSVNEINAYLKRYGVAGTLYTVKAKLREEVYTRTFDFVHKGTTYRVDGCTKDVETITKNGGSISTDYKRLPDDVVEFRTALSSLESKR